MEPRVSFITFGVQDMDISSRFYDLMGWDSVKETKYESIIFYKLHNLIFGIYPWHKLAEDVTQEPTNDPSTKNPLMNDPMNQSSDKLLFRGITLSHNVASREEVSPILQKAESSGGKIIKEAQDVFWGGFSGYFADPDGYLWEIVWNPHISPSEQIQNKERNNSHEKAPSIPPKMGPNKGTIKP